MSWLSEWIKKTQRGAEPKDAAVEVVLDYAFKQLGGSNRDKLHESFQMMKTAIDIVMVSNPDPRLVEAQRVAKMLVEKTERKV